MGEGLRGGSELSAGSGDWQAPAGAAGVGEGEDADELAARFDAVFDRVVAEPIGLADGGEGNGGP
jgi:hypothetical protein